MFVNKPPSFDSLRLPEDFMYTPPDIITETADLPLGSYVFKQGGKPGVTCGLVTSSDFYQYCRSSDLLGPPDKPAVFLTFWIQHHAIHGINDLCFSEKGDSGSWLVDLQGRLVAMLHSRLCDGPHDIDVGTSIRETFEQIPLKTGCSVHLPTLLTRKRDIWDVLLHRRPVSITWTPV